MKLSSSYLLRAALGDRELDVAKALTSGTGAFRSKRSILFIFMVNICCPKELDERVRVNNPASRQVLIVLGSLETVGIHGHHNCPKKTESKLIFCHAARSDASGGRPKRRREAGFRMHPRRLA
jgi:hypothetical protein